MEGLHACRLGVAAAGGLRQCRRGCRSIDRPQRRLAPCCWNMEWAGGPLTSTLPAGVSPPPRRRAAMPDAVAPGVYVEEAPAGARVIAGVPTSTAAFLGATQAGPVAAPLLVHSFAEFEAQFGGLAAEMPLGYAVQQYFVNGGRGAVVPPVGARRPAPPAAPLP